MPGLRLADESIFGGFWWAIEAPGAQGAPGQLSLLASPRGSLLIHCLTLSISLKGIIKWSFERQVFESPTSGLKNSNNPLC